MTLRLALLVPNARHRDNGDGIMAMGNRAFSASDVRGEIFLHDDRGP